MKLVIFTIFFLFPDLLLYGQDTVMHTRTGRVELTKKGLGNVYDVSGIFNSNFNNPGSKNKWIEGQVKKIEYEYLFIPTYYGSTQPANPKEFYKPRKYTGHYYLPVSDFTIWYNNKIAQILKLDSCILRSYYENGSIKSIHYFNKNLETDSIFQFYSNGKLKLKQLGNWRQQENNLSLVFSQTVYLSERKTIKSKIDIGYHGNGLPQLKVEFMPAKEELAALEEARTSKELPVYNMGSLYPLQEFNLNYRRAGYINTYTFYDTNGNVTTDNYITSDHAWTGTKYEYFENGNLYTKKDLYRDGANGIYEYWNKEGELLYRQYYRKQHHDSTVFYKRIQDTVFTWKGPASFVWYETGEIKTIKNHNVCELDFNKDGNLRFCKFEGNTFYTDKEQKDEKLILTYTGKKDKYGLPHGRWLGINKFRDTIFDVHFKHGYLHGKYQVNYEKHKQKWIRNYYKGIECDSSSKYHNGIKNSITYYSAPGIYSKKMEYYGDGNLHRIDTSLNGKTFYTILLLGSNETIVEKATIDTINHRIHLQRFSSNNQLESETWYENYYSVSEWKTYYPGTNQVKQHGVYTGTTKIPNVSKKDIYDERGEFVETVSVDRTVRNAIRKTYDEKGILIEEVKLQDGIIIE